MTRLPASRFGVFAGVVGLWGILVAGRLFQLQVVKGASYRVRAEQQQERTIVLSPRRGSILDRNGKELAVSLDATSVFAVPEKVRDAKTEARRIASIVNLPAGEVVKKLRDNRPFVWIARKINDAAAQQLKALNLPGVDFLTEARRFYPNGDLAAGVLGYVGLDGRGLGGVEYQYDGLIHGRPGRLRVERDARQGQYALTPVPGHEAQPGATVELTLDRDLQYVVEQELAQAVTRAHARDGAAVAMDPRTGQILAMASEPTFDPNLYTEYSPSDWRNRAISQAYEPGSVFKLITASTAMQDGVVSPGDLVDCGQGFIQVGRFRIHDAEHERFGAIPFWEVIAKSSNSGAIRVGLELGPDRLYAGARMFGIGSPTGVDLPGENPGILRTPTHWSELSNASISMGQEVSVTPLQLAVAYSAVANGGYRVEPTVVRGFLEASGQTRPVEPRPAVQIISTATAGRMTEILEDVVREGTGKAAAVAGYAVAGKTGTAQKAIGHGYAEGKYVSTFAGFLPAGNPRLVLVVMVDEPEGAYFAAAVAAPIFHNIAVRAMTIMNVPPDGAVVPFPPVVPPVVVARGGSSFAPDIEPAALRRGTRQISAGMPDLSGLPLRTAVAELSRRGVGARLTGTGFVVKQQPAPGTPIEPGQTCQLYLAESPSS